MLVVKEGLLVQDLMVVEVDMQDKVILEVEVEPQILE